MRIGVVTTSYPRAPGDPAGSFVAAHVEAMRALGHEVDVISARDIRSPLFEQSGAPEALECGGFADRTRAMLDGALFTAKLTAAIARRIGHWDAVIAHWLPCALAALPAIATTRKPLLAIAHGGDVHTLRRTQLLRPTVKALELAGAKLAFVSAELRELAGARDALVQPMGVDVERFARLARTPTMPPTIAVIGRLVPIKGIDVAIDAMTHVGLAARLVIAGDGPERVALEARASRAMAHVGARSATTDARSALESRGSPAMTHVGIRGALAGDRLAPAMTHVGTTVRLVIAGDGPERVALEARGARARTHEGAHELVDDGAALAVHSATTQTGDDASRSSIVFAGQLDPARRDELLARASLVIIPSRVLPNGRSEGTPLVALEALAAGVPVIASDVGGLRELANIERVPADDPRALAAAIDRVLASPPSSGALRAGIAHLAWPHVAQRYLDVLVAR